MQHRPKRSLGHNFLRDASISQRIVDALEPRPGDQVIEIGPGQGALTERLIAAGANVTAIEFDRDLAPMLREKFAEARDFSVVEADALATNFKEVADTHFRSEISDLKTKLVANLPYNISTPILQRLIEQREVLSRLVLMFQREVVERITAEPRSKERGYLSVIAQNALEIEYLFDVPPTAFYPVPKVWSAVIRLTPKPRADDEQKFREVVSQAFLQKRKTLANNLSRGYPTIAAVIREMGLPAKIRAEELTVDAWHNLVGRL